MTAPGTTDEAPAPAPAVPELAEAEAAVPPPTDERVALFLRTFHEVWPGVHRRAMARPRRRDPTDVAGGVALPLGAGRGSFSTGIASQRTAVSKASPTAWQCCSSWRTRSGPARTRRDCRCNGAASVLPRARGRARRANDVDGAARRDNRDRARRLLTTQDAARAFDLLSANPKSHFTLILRTLGRLMVLEGAAAVDLAVQLYPMLRVRAHAPKRIEPLHAAGRMGRIVEARRERGCECGGFQR